MATTHSESSTGIVLQAKAADLSVRAVAEEGIGRQLASRPVHCDGDDVQRYRDGLRVGRRWARTVATTADLAGLAALAGARWRDFRIEASHSLCAVLVEEGRVKPDAMGEAWLSRGPFADGIIEAALVATSGS